jgi:iron complex outermembrane recepter protein
MNHRRLLMSAVAGSVMAGALGAPVAFAQSGAAPAADDNVVIVNAQRRSENIQDVPVAVTAFTPVQIEAAQITDTAALVRFTPSLTGGLNTGTGAAVSYFIRGLGSTEQVPSFDVPVATYVDEVYIARQSANNVALLDVQQVEVLRGPQGTLFGRNTTGGAISITTRKPSSEFGWYADFGFGDFGRTELKASVDAPINDRAFTKFTILASSDDGYARSVTTGETLNGEDTLGLRAALRWDISDSVDWNVSFEWLDQQKTTIGSLAFDPEYVSRTGLRQTDCDDDIIETFLSQRLGNCSSIESAAITSNLGWNLGWAQVNFITGYRTVNQDFALDFLGGTGPAGGFTIANEVENTSFSQEVKITGETGRFNWVAGLFYFTEDNTTDQLDTFGALILGDRRMVNGTDTFAVYAQTDIALTDRLTATLGLRATGEKKDVSFIDTVKTNAGGPGYPPGWLTFLIAPPSNRPTDANLRALGIPLDQDEQKLTPRIALRYEVTDDIMLFASATEGFKSGGWNGRPNTAPTATAFGPETARTYEIGARTELFDSMLRFNATLYRLDVEDLQLLSGFNVPGGGIAFVTRNTGGLEATGLELEAYLSPTDNLDFFLSASFADSKYVDIPAANGVGNVPCSTTPEPAQCTTERDRPVRFPDRQLSAGFNAAIPATIAGGELSFNGSVSYSSEYWTSTYNDTGTSTGVPFGSPTGTAPVTANFSFVGDTTLVNLGAAWESGNGNWKLSVDCSNCTEEYYLTSSLAGVGYPNAPRRLMGRIRFTY